MVKHFKGNKICVADAECKSGGKYGVKFTCTPKDDKAKKIDDAKLQDVGGIANIGKYGKDGKKIVTKEATASKSSPSSTGATGSGTSAQPVGAGSELVK